MPHKKNHRPVHEIMFHKVMKDITLDTTQSTLAMITENITKGKLKIGDDEVNIPLNNLKFSIKHERKPKGELALKIEIEWCSESIEEITTFDSLEIS